MNTTVVLLNDMGRWLVTQLGRMSVELAILAGIVLIVLYVLRVKSPALRHLFWGLLLAKPVVTFLVASPLSLYGFFWPTMPEVFYTSAPEPVLMESAPFQPSVQTAFVPEAPPIEPSRPEPTPFWRQIDRYGLISALWAVVASLFGLRLLLGCAYVSFLRSTAMTQREGPLADLVAEAESPLRMRRRVRIATTRVAHGPVLAGIFRPVILLPEHMAEALTPKQMKLVITHELAHARRWDNLVLLIQRLAEMFFFFHPVVWFCGWMMRREAEAACDDMVVSAYGDAEGAGAAAYADSLTRVAEMKCGITHRLLVNTFAAAESNFHRRIRRILSGRRGRMTLWLSLATGAALVFIGLTGLPTVLSKSADQAYWMEFDKASVTNLHRNSMVTYIGVPVGKVTSVQISGNDNARIEVLIDPGRVTLREGVKAQLEMFNTLPTKPIWYRLLASIQNKEQTAKYTELAVSLTDGDPNASELAPGSKIPTRTEGDSNIKELLDKVPPILETTNNDASGVSGSDPLIAAKEAVEAKWDGINSFTAVVESKNDGDEIRGPYSMLSRISALKNAEGVLMYRLETDKIIFENPDRKGWEKHLKVFDGKDAYREMHTDEGIEVRVRKDAFDTEFGMGIVGVRSNFEECFKNETFTLLPDEEMDGKTVYVFEGQPKRSDKLSKYRLYIDKETGLELKYEREKKRSILSEVKLNVPVDASLFKYTPPENATVIDSSDPTTATQVVTSSLQSAGEGESTFPGQSSGEAAAVPAPQPETEAKSFSVPFKEGRSVELVGVRRLGTDNAVFWRPDGTPLAEQPPFDHTEPTVTANGTKCELAFRITGIDLSLPIKFDYDNMFTGPTTPIGDNLLPIPGFMGYVIFVKDDPQSVNMRLKFASADWTSVLSHEQVGSSSSAYSMDTYSVTFAEPYEKDNTVHVTVTFTGTLAESALRLVAMDKSGQPHAGNLSSGGSVAEKVLQNTYSFTDVKLEDIQSFQVETCPWEEVEFTNVSLAAGRHTDCDVTAKATVKIPKEQIQKVTLNTKSEIELFLNGPKVAGNPDKGTLPVASLDGTKGFQISALQNVPPISGPFRVAPLVGCLSEKIKQDCKTQGITDGPAIVKKLQEVTLEMMRKGLDSASLQEVSLREGAHNRIIVEPPAGMDIKQVMPIFKVPGTVRFCPAASVEETLEALRNAEKDPRFQGRIEPLIDLDTRKGYVSIKPDQRKAATELLSELQSVLPENKFFLCGARQDPNALYLLDFNTSMPNIKVRSAEAAPDENNPGQAMVLIMLGDADAQYLGELTQSLIGKSLAILVDSEIQMVSTVRDRITNGIQLVGNYMPEEATELAARLSSPGYPVPLAFLPGSGETSETLEERTYENINEDVLKKIKTHILPVYDPNTGEELSTLSYGKASGRLTIRNLQDNFSWFERLLGQLGLPKRIKISSASSQLASCANNLKQCGLVLKLYANEASQQMFPPLSSLPGCLMWHKEAVYPLYLTDPTILICPTEEEKLQQTNGMEKPEDKAKFCFDNSTYWYLGYAIPDEKTGLAFVEAYKKQAQAGLGFDADLKDEEGLLILRLREGVERAFITDIHNPAGAAMVQSELPIFIERPGHHDNKVNVVFLDGHVEWPTYPGDFPVSKRFIEALESLDALRKQGEVFKINPQGGEVVDGLQAVLKAEKEQWAAGETPQFTVSLQNVGAGTLGIDDPPVGVVIEYDGVQYTVSNAGMMSAPGLFSRGVYGLQGSLDKELIDAEKRPLALMPGKHTVRVAFHVHPPQGAEGAPALVFSNPVAVEIGGVAPQSGVQLVFPDDITVGELYTRPAAEPFYAPFDPAGGRESWKYHAEAQGTVGIPPGVQVRLEVPDARLFQHLTGLQADALQSLSLRGSNLQDEEVSSIARLTGLRALDCEHNASLTDKGLGYLSGLKQLEWLHLGLTGVSLAEAGSFPELEQLWYLDLNQCPLSKNALNVISKLPGLRWINLEDTNIHAADLEQLTLCPRLEGLSLCECNVDQSPVPFMVRLKAVPALPVLMPVKNNLRYLNLGNEMQITDADLKLLEGLPNLQYLSLRKNKGVTDAGMAALTNLKELRYLDLRETGITNAALTSLKSLPHLSEVQCAFTAVDEQQADVINSGREEAASNPRQASSNPNALKVGLLMSHFTATGPSWRGEPYGYEHQASEEFAAVLDQMNFDVYAIIEPGTAAKSALPRILAKTGLRDKTIELTDLPALLNLNVIVIKKCNNAIPEMVGALRQAVESGVGIVDIGGFGRVTPGYNAEIEDFYGVSNTGYSYYLEAIDAPVLQQHPILGDLKPGDTIGIDVPDGFTVPNGVRDGAVLLGGTDKLDDNFCALMVREVGKGRMVVGNWYYLTLPRCPWGPYGLYLRCINWAAHQPVDAKWASDTPVPVNGLVQIESLKYLKELRFENAKNVSLDGFKQLREKVPGLTVKIEGASFEELPITSQNPEQVAESPPAPQVPEPTKGTAAQATTNIGVLAGEQPASEAEVTIARPGWWITCRNGKIRDAVDHRRSATAETYKTDSSGRLTLPDIQEPFLLVVTHPFGYALVSGKSPDAASIALTPWGAVEGQLQLSGVMCVDTGMAGTTSQYFDINAQAAAPSIGDNEEIQIMFISESRTDDNAHYVLSHLMAGKATVYPLIEDVNGIGNPVTGLITDATIVSGASTLLNFGQARFRVAGRLVGREGFTSIDWTGVKADLTLEAPHIGMPGDEELWRAQGAFAESDKGRLYFQDVPIAANGTFHMDEVPEGSFFFRFYVPPAAAGMSDTASKSVGQGGRSFALSAAAMKPGESTFDLGTFDVAINNAVTDTQKETAPPDNTPTPAVTPQSSADALDKTMALAEFQLYVAHGAVTQKGNPLPGNWDGKSYRPILRWLLNSAGEADAYAVGGTPLVMEGNTLTWAGKETPDPGCATLAASYSFMMRRDESTNLTISMPPEAGLPTAISSKAEMKVACQLISKDQIRLWLIMPQPTEVSPEDKLTWTNVAATAPQDTWQLMVLDVPNEENETQTPMLLCWKFRYGMEQDLKWITPPATVGNVVLSQSPAPDMTHVPQYSTEAKILSGPVEAIERFVNTLETIEEARVTPENTRAFRVADKNEIQALLETLDKQTPGLELLSAPRITMMSAEDKAKVDGDKAPEMVGPPSQPEQPDPLQDIFSSGQNRVVLKGSPPREFWQKNMGPYSASLVDFLQGEQYPGVISDMTTEYSNVPGVPEPVPTRAGIAVAVSLHKTDDPQIMDLRLYFNSKEREPKGFFESPVTLVTPFPLGQCIGFVTVNPDPEKKTLVLLTLEQVGTGAQFFES